MHSLVLCVPRVETEYAFGEIGWESNVVRLVEIEEMVVDGGFILFRFRRRVLRDILLLLLLMYAVIDGIWRPLDRFFQLCLTGLLVLLLVTVPPTLAADTPSASSTFQALLLLFRFSWYDINQEIEEIRLLDRFRDIDLCESPPLGRVYIRSCCELGYEYCRKRIERGKLVDGGNDSTLTGLFQYHGNFGSDHLRGENWSIVLRKGAG